MITCIILNNLCGIDIIIIIIVITIFCIFTEKNN